MKICWKHSLAFLIRARILLVDKRSITIVCVLLKVCCRKTPTRFISSLFLVWRFISHDLVRWMDDQVVSCYRLFYFSPFAFAVLFSSFSIALFCIPITSPYRITILNSHSVPAVGTGNDSVRNFLADFACRFFHDLGRWMDDQVVSCLRLIYFSPFAFAVLFSSFSIALLYTHITSPYRMSFGTPFRVCRCSR